MKSERINLGFYRFYPVQLPLEFLREELEILCAKLGLLGTILLSKEGINVMITGTRAMVDEFKAYAEKNIDVSKTSFKETVVFEDSFHRMLVKIKNEIISVGDPDLKPHEKTAKRLTAAEYKNWMDEKKPMVLLDTRNHYEVEVGTFKNAKHLSLETSRDFAEKVEPYLEEWKNIPVLTFCTGGIRCEKASAYLLKKGLPEVYQLDGGILRYFEENGGENFVGNCFVFDWRLAVDGNLRAVPRSDDPEQEFGRHKKKFVKK